MIEELRYFEDFMLVSLVLLIWLGRRPSNV